MALSTGARIRLIAWTEEAVEDGVTRLQAAGYEVVSDALGPNTLRELGMSPPTAVVIDLARRPSTGRDIALAIRQRKATRHVSLVLVDGDPEEVVRIQRLLPDAVYTTRRALVGSLRRSIHRPPSSPVVPTSLFAAYAGVVLSKKLGIKANSVVALVGARPGFEKVLGKLPPGATVRAREGGRRDLTMWFIGSRQELEQRIERMTRFAENGGLWIVWPKKTSGIGSDLSQPVVRKIGLAAGLVDFKVCAIDSTWTGLRFSRPSPGKGARR